MTNENQGFSLVRRRTHKVVARDHTRLIKLGNGQLIVTIPREVSRWKRIGKGTLLKWQDGGENRLIVEVRLDKVVK